MDDDDWRGKAAVDAVRTALMGWDGTTALEIVAEALRRIPPDLDTHLRRAGACGRRARRAAQGGGVMAVDTIKAAKEAAEEAAGQAAKLPDYLSDVERLIKAARRLIERSSSVVDEERSGNWAPDDAWDDLLFELQRVE